MRRIKIATTADMAALPEGEWFEVPDGVDLKVTHEPVRPRRKRRTKRAA